MSELSRDFTGADLPAVRAEVENFGAAQGLDELTLYRLVAAVHELATNAIRHGGGEGHLQLRRSGAAVRCRVSDRGPGFPRPAPEPVAPGLRTLNGRGLWYVRNVASALDIASGAAGSTVTMTIPAPGSSAGG